MDQPFGGYAINFKGIEATMEDIFGLEPITPAQMTKKLWEFVKTHGLGAKDRTGE